MLLHTIPSYTNTVITLDAAEIAQFGEVKATQRRDNCYAYTVEVEFKAGGRKVDIWAEFSTEEEGRGHYSNNPCEDTSWSEEVVMEDSFEFEVFVTEPDGDYSDYYELDEPTQVAIKQQIINKF